MVKGEIKLDNKYPWAQCSSNQSTPARAAACVLATNSWQTASISARVMAFATWLTPGKYCCSDAETSGQLPDSSGLSMPSHATRVDALAPACPICIANLASLWLCTQSTMRFHAAVCSGGYIPGQPGVIRPWALTQVISANTIAAPPIARAPR